MSDSLDFDKALTTAVSATERAGQHIRKYEGDPRPREKAPGQLVSDADLRAEDIILDILRSAYPDHQRFSEEKGYEGDPSSNYLWVVDPIDGSRNFIKRFPHYNISIGLLYKRKPVLGSVYQPVLNEQFSAIADQGAWLNGEPIEASVTTNVSETLVAVNRDWTAKSRYGKGFESLNDVVGSIRILGATAVDLCYVACGRLDALIIYQCRLHDCAAGNLIALQAGATVTDFQGNAWTGDEQSDLLVANPRLHGKLIPIVKNL